mmetsp:Transcript_82272/g.155094  ORF Transcript_82272/g.155094 Transcript_82272/m.155094 type:complete len:101 (-) Transcript_82272:317-619(-)
MDTAARSHAKERHTDSWHNPSLNIHAGTREQPCTAEIRKVAQQENWERCNQTEWNIQGDHGDYYIQEKRASQEWKTRSLIIDVIPKTSNLVSIVTSVKYQ